MSESISEEAGRTLAIGDVHGCNTALDALLKLIAPTAEDTVVFLGDLVDRGPGTKQVLDAVIALQRRCRVIVIRGNHEEMMLRAINGWYWHMWMEFGGDEALVSYGDDADPAQENVDVIPESHVDLLNEAVEYWETPSHIFVHANLEPGIPLDEQLGVFLRWSHLSGGEIPFDPHRRVVCGHTPQKDGYPLAFPGWVCIDTYAHGGGWLTCLDVDADLVCQANEAGPTREFPLGWRE